MIYETVKRKILDVEFEPGTRLIIDKLARENGVSSTPVREALARLLSERLVLFKPNSGYLVSDLPDNQFFADLIEYRMLVECHAARLGAPRRDHGILKRLHEAMWEMERLPLGRDYENFRLFSVWDARFHGILIHSAGNQVLDQSFANLQSHLQLSRLYRHLRQQVQKDDVLLDHSAIVSAFDAGDGDEAARTVQVHIGNTRKMLEYEVKSEKSADIGAAGSNVVAGRHDSAEHGAPKPRGKKQHVKQKAK